MEVAIASQFDRDLHSLNLNWSKYTGPAVRCGFEAEMASSVTHSEFADKLQMALGINRNSIAVNDTYGASHYGDYKYWSVESDTSIHTEPGYLEKIELVSPILGIDAMLSSLEKVCELMSNVAVTNSSTGLHMTFSLADTELAKVNIVKLYLLLGEDYWKLVFGRNDTQFAKSIKPAIVSMVADLTKNAGLEKLKSFDLQQFMSEMRSLEIGRYGTINVEHLLQEDDRQDTSRIEFRLPGGTGYERKFSMLSRVARRFAYALYASTCDAYDDVFALKLYKFVDKYSQKKMSDIRVRVLPNSNGFSIVALNGTDYAVRLFSFIYGPAGITKIKSTLDEDSFDVVEVKRQLDALADKYKGTQLQLHGKIYSLQSNVLLPLDNTSCNVLTSSDYLKEILSLFGLSTNTAIAEMVVLALESNSSFVNVLFNYIQAKVAQRVAKSTFATIGYFVAHNYDNFDVDLVYRSDYFGDHTYARSSFLAGLGLLPRDGIDNAFTTGLCELIEAKQYPKYLTSVTVGKIAAIVLTGNTEDASDAYSILATLVAAGYSVDAQEAGTALAQALVASSQDIDRLYQDKREAEGYIDKVYSAAESLGFADSIRPVFVQIIKDHGGWSATDASFGLPRSEVLFDLSDSELSAIGINIKHVDINPQTSRDVAILLKDASQHRYSKDTILKIFNSAEMLAIVKSPDFLANDDYPTVAVEAWVSLFPIVRGSLLSNEVLHNPDIAINFKDLGNFTTSSLVKLSYEDVNTIYTTMANSTHLDYLFWQIVGDTQVTKSLEEYLTWYINYAISNQRSSNRVEKPPSIYVPLMNETGVMLLKRFISAGYIEKVDRGSLKASFRLWGDMYDLSDEIPHCLLLDKLFASYKAMVVEQDNAAAANGMTTVSGHVLNMLHSESIDVREATPLSFSEYRKAPSNYVHQVTEPEKAPESPEDQRSVDQMLSYISHPPYDIPAFSHALLVALEGDLDSLMYKLSVSDNATKSMGFSTIVSGAIYPIDGMGTRLSNPSILTVGLTFHTFVSLLISNLIGDAASEDMAGAGVAAQAPRVYGYTWDDFLYYLLNPRTTLPSHPDGDTTNKARDYFMMLGYLTSVASPDVLFSVKSLSFYNKLVAAEEITKASRSDSRDMLNGLVVGMQLSQKKTLVPGRNYPLLNALSKYGGFTRRYLDFKLKSRMIQPTQS